jgi:hypothetical protein
VLGFLGGKAHRLVFHGSGSADILTAVSGSGRIKGWDGIRRKQIRELEIDMHGGWHALH